MENQFKDKNIWFEGGVGSSFEDAVKIFGATSTATDIGAEKLFISNKFGEEGNDWDFVEQHLFLNDKAFDVLTIRLPDDSLQQIFFDISEFFGNL